ncbi:hypothetical protein HWV62_25874 [Athelia sp. TMB]|nr:hypothetical protein HWV62_25874 [Athelia sp. TMB]
MKASRPVEGSVDDSESDTEANPTRLLEYAGRLDHASGMIMDRRTTSVRHAVCALQRLVEATEYTKRAESSAQTQELTAAGGWRAVLRRDVAILSALMRYINELTSNYRRSTPFETFPEAQLQKIGA